MLQKNTGCLLVMRLFMLLSCLFLHVSFAYLLQDTTIAAETLSLEDCIKIVINKNPSLAMSQAEMEQKKALLRSSKKDLLPTLSAHYTYTHSPDSLLPPHDTFAYGITAEQPLYQGKELVTSIDQAELAVSLAQLSLEQTVNDLVYEVHLRYYTLLRALKLEEEARQALLRLTSHLNDAQAFYEAGLIPKNDMLHSEVELAQGEQDLVDAGQLTSMAQARLNVLLERPIGSPLHIIDITEDEIANISWDEVISKAKENRTEISQAERAVQIAKNDIILKKAPYLPSVSLQASYERLGDEVGGSPYPGTTSEIKTIKAVASWKLWTWLKNKDEVLAAQNKLKVAKQSVKKSVDDVSLDARNAYLRLEQAAKRINVSEKTIEHARENYRINKEQYMAQLSTSTDVLDAQTLLSQAMTNYHDALYGYQLALAAIDKSEGLLGQRYSK